MSKSSSQHVTTSMVVSSMMAMTMIAIISVSFFTIARAGSDQESPHLGVESKSEGHRYGYLYNSNSQRWDNAADGTRVENSIQNDDRQSVFKSQQDYVCGRAIANRKYKDLMLRDLSYQASTSRAKYRPLEIRMPRIIGGDETAPGEFPWASSVKLNGQPICGGSLIDKSWILTAAHCVVGYNPKNMSVRLGAYRIKDQSETQTLDLPVSMFIVHKEYSMPRPFSNDIALVKLEEPVEFTDFIIPICLPIEDQFAVGSMGSHTNDYSSTRYTTTTTNNNNKQHMLLDESDLGGIVVSTKMSDKEIANCFYRLEQNYLNSIGLGDTIEETTETSSENAQRVSSSSSQSPARATTTTTTRAGQLQVSTPLPASVEGDALFSYGDLLEPIFGDHPPYHQVSTTSNHQKIKFIQSQHQQQHFAASRPDFHVMSNHRPDSHGNANSNSIAANDNNNNNNALYQQMQHNNYVYYGIPWNSRQVGQQMVAKTGFGETEIGSNSADEKRADDDKNEIGVNLAPKVQQFKLSRLPMSKELLREIQSVGTGPMPALNLNLQHGDIVAMASDLAGAAASQPESTAMADSASRGERINGHKFNKNSDSFNGNDIDSDENHVEDDTAAKSYSGLSGTVVGWGWVREVNGEDYQFSNKGYPSVTLQKVRLPILRNNVCEAWFQSQAKKITLLPSQFCAGFNSGGKDACRGDSGGPMIIEDNSDIGRYKLIGIVSAGIGCARPSLPGLYTRVASFLPWINAQLARY